MSRYIDVEDAVKMFITMTGYGGRAVFELVPSPPDVVEVVRCKDCKYYLHSNEKCELIDTRLHFYETDNTWAEDAFCAWGKRREDD